MIRKTLSYLILPVIATGALLVLAEPAAAQHGGGHGGGGHVGGGHVGGVHFGAVHGGVFHGGVGGYHYGYHPNYYGYNRYPYYGHGSYPYYGYGNSSYYGFGDYPYYSADPSLSTDGTIDPTTSSGQAPDLTNGTGDNSAGSSPPTGAPVSADRPANITARLPDDADLWFDGTKTTATGPVRLFTTPPLTSGRRYTYEVRAHWNNGEGVMDQKQTLLVTAGANLDVSFPVPSGTGEKAKGTTTPEGGR
ncbi:MAG: hypothetical protein JWO38_5111 [Gemmataceae bacterium]|nr:hypothetical protein [Gemmataceae bacterium]